MKTRSSANWKEPPGGWDSLHTSQLFSEPDDYLGIPGLLPQAGDFRLPEPLRLLPYRSRRPEGAVCHFFLDDYRFESVWRAPLKSLRHVCRYRAVLTPDFSLLTHWPPALQIFNVYRSRWMGRFWQSQGLDVIPTVCWSTPESYRAAFAGIPPGQIVAVSVPDIRRPRAGSLFAHGFEAMVRRLDPRLVIVYGRLPFECERALCVPPAWESLRGIATEKAA